MCQLSGLSITRVPSTAQIGQPSRWTLSPQSSPLCPTMSHSHDISIILLSKFHYTATSEQNRIILELQFTLKMRTSQWRRHVTPKVFSRAGSSVYLIFHGFYLVFYFAHFLLMPKQHKLSVVLLRKFAVSYKLQHASLNWNSTHVPTRAYSFK